MSTSQQLLALLPSEGWATILSQITFHRDRLNCAYASPLFQGILESEQDAWILSLFTLAFPSIYHFLTRTEILILRQVSKGWNAAVDNFHENGLFEKTLSDFDDHKVKLNLTKHLLGSNLNQFDLFLQEMRQFPNAKIVGGVVISEDDYGDFVDFRPFFREFGEKVKHLKLVYFEATEERNPIEMITYIYDVLNCTPNLQTLYLSASADDQQVDIPHLLWEDRVACYLKSNSLPKLEKLRTLAIELYCEEEILRMLYEEIVKVYGKQLWRFFLY